MQEVGKDGTNEYLREDGSVALILKSLYHLIKDDSPNSSRNYLSQAICRLALVPENFSGYVDLGLAARLRLADNEAQAVQQCLDYLQGIYQRYENLRTFAREQALGVYPGWTMRYRFLYDSDFLGTYSNQVLLLETLKKLWHIFKPTSLEIKYFSDTLTCREERERLTCYYQADPAHWDYLIKWKFDKGGQAQQFVCEDSVIEDVSNLIIQGAKQVLVCSGEIMCADPGGFLELEECLRASRPQKE